MKMNKKKVISDRKSFTFYEYKPSKLGYTYNPTGKKYKVSGKNLSPKTASVVVHHNKKINPKHKLIYFGKRHNYEFY